MTTNNTYADKFCVYSNPCHLHFNGKPIWYVVQIIQGGKYETTGFVIKSITRWSDEAEARRYITNVLAETEELKMKKTELSDFERQQKRCADNEFVYTLENVKLLLHNFRGDPDIDAAVGNLNEALEKRDI